VALGCVFLSGASMLWLPGFNTAELLRFLPECTTFMGVPTYYTRLLGDEKFGRQHCTNARVFISGSAPLLEATFSDFQDRTGHTILERYGMTETGMNTSNPLHGDRKPGTVGPPLPGVSLRVVDDQGVIVATGETGNVQVKGPNVFQGYWKKPDKTADDFTSDGFFNTGDQGVMDQDGYLALVGRSKDMIISGGLNIYPKEIELVLDSKAGIIESAVIGVPHPDFGEAVVAVLVQTADGAQTEQSIIEAIRQELADFKVPKRVFMVDELPRNAMGKVQKNRLRERYIDCCQPVSNHLS
jgi:malonyl-CoA/methylmalonyl-CoA synthetase